MGFLFKRTTLCISLFLLATVRASHGPQSTQLVARTPRYGLPRLRRNGHLTR
jgi:hypothetical protein